MIVFLYISSLYKLVKYICMNLKLIRLIIVWCLFVGIWWWGNYYICLYDKENKKSYVLCRWKDFIIMIIYV